MSASLVTPESAVDCTSPASSASSVSPNALIRPKLLVFESNNAENVTMENQSLFKNAHVKSPSVSPSPTSPSAFLPEMPQWKKDLIQRRKTNVARSSILATDTLTSVTNVNAATATSANDDHEQHNYEDFVEGVEDEDCGQTDVSENKLKFQTKVQKQQRQQQQQETSQIKENQTNTTTTLAPTIATKKPATSAAVAAVSGQQQLWQQKNVKTKMPVTTTTPQGNHELNITTTPTAATANILVKSPTSPSIREKAEKLLYSGGHYTPPVTLESKRIKRKNEDLIGIFSKATSDVAADNNFSTSSSSSSSSSTTSSLLSTTNLVQKQRTLYEISTDSSVTNNTNIQTSKSTKELIETTTKKQQLEMDKEEIEVQETMSSRIATSLNFDGNNSSSSGAQLDTSSCSTRTIRARSPLAQQQQPQLNQQSYLKRDSEQTCLGACFTTKLQKQNEQELLLPTNNSGNNNKNNHCGTINSTLTDGIKNNKKLFNSWQNNQFVKNQTQQQQLSPKKFNNHNNKKKQEIATSVTGSPTKLVYASAVVAATTASSVGVSVKNKMVAVQEMKKSTQNASHPHHRVHNQRHAPIIGGSNNEGCGNEQQQNNSATNYDSGEDLSYGPGIVEKLRVRYLSWAQRESLVEQQRRSLETLRRATSLSTLLDREQPLDDEEEDEMVEQQSAQKTVLDQNNYNSQQHKATPVPAQRQSISNNQQLKVVAGILKSGGNNFNETIKKTATFENNSNENGKGNSEITSSGTRGSRTLKRGNDSLKRARSVEALLSERVAWNFNPSANSSFSGSVTIEDKINNARDRLVMGTDVMPPKRLTSIIDETERPPPDLVKQTLKKFEATANRRPRPSRANSKGEVASKVATFKSIINEHKPAVILPKPPNSPTKRPSHIEGVTLKPVAKPIVVAVEDVLHSPTGRRTTNKNNVLSDHTPDLIPRQKHLIGKLQNNSPTMADSPVTALTKRIEKLRLSTGGNETKTESTRCATNSDMTEEKNGNHDQNENENENVKENSVKNIENKQFVGDDEAQSTEMAAAVAATSDDIRKNDDEVLDIVAFSVDKHSQSQQNTDDDDLEETAGIVSPSNSSVFSDDEDSLGLTKRVSRKALENIAKAGTTQQFKFSNSSNTNQDLLNTSTPLSALSENNSSAMRPLLNSAATSTVKQKSASFAAHLTSREIEKNRINELKKTTTTTQESSPSGASSSVSSLNNVIQQQQQKQAQASPSSTGQSELDASGSPLWASMCKRRVAPPVAVADNTTMVFNFSNRKEVPDYIDNDGVIFRRKRELPKPNESGFVMLGDLTVETSTDSDYDDFSMCPPSPCDVEFENANIVIDGKSSIRYKSKDATVRVQFNDTLTSTFEYPSEASFIVDDDVFHSPYSNTDSSSLIRNFENLALEEPDSPAHQRHHHVAVDEIIPIPTTTANYILPQINVTNVNNTNTTTTNTNTPTKNVLGNLPLGSAPLGSYTPVKAPIDNLFQLGVTRAPNTNGHVQPNTQANGEIRGDCNGSVIGISDGLINCNGDDEAPDSLQQYLKPANDDLTLAYSEGTQKTDLLY